MSAWVFGINIPPTLREDYDPKNRGRGEGVRTEFMGESRWDDLPVPLVSL